MVTPTIALALALAPPNPTGPAGFEVADIEAEPGPRSSHLTAYDSDGEVSAEIVVWLDADEQLRLDVNFADGLYLRSFDGEVETDDAAEVAARLTEIRDYLDTEQPQEGLGWCAGGVAVLAVSAWFVNPPAW